MFVTALINRVCLRATRFFPLFLVLLLVSGCIGVAPRHFHAPEPMHDLGQDWRKHYRYGVALLEQTYTSNQQSVFARAAFSSASRFARDHAPSYAGLGLVNMELGYYAEAQGAFLNAAMLDDQSLYWALAVMAALRNSDERVARTLYDAMRAARSQGDDPVSKFVRTLYDENASGVQAPLVVIPGHQPILDVDENLVCESGSDDALCRNLNVVASVYFVRRSSSDITSRGTDFFNKLTFQLGAESTASRSTGEKLDVFRSATLSIPDIQYAVRLTPLNSSTNLYLNAAPSVITSIGEASELREGSDLTILYNSEGYSEDFTAKTGIFLSIEPELATPEYVKLKLGFELSSIAALTPSLSAQVLDVSANQYTISGYFPYGKPVVLGTISSGSQQQRDGGQKGLRRLPLFGSNFGQSRDELSSSDTLVLGVLSEPAVFRGSHEQRLLAAMRDRGLRTPEYDVIRRRNILHQAPDVPAFLVGFLKQHARELVLD